jgi:uncharacterized membrane protein YdfJ with MMPL/SSD domain
VTRLSDWLDRRRWIVLGVWVALIAAAIPFATRRTEHLSVGGFSVPGSQSQRVSEELRRVFPRHSKELAVVVVPRANATAAQRRALAAHLVRLVATTKNTDLSPAAGEQAVSSVARGRLGLLAIRVPGGEGTEPDVAGRLRKRLHADGSNIGAVTAYVIGRGALDEGVVRLSEKQLVAAEDIGFPFVLVILLAIFGSIAAAGLPALLGVAAITLTGATIFFLSQATTMSVLSLNVASMVGIGVAVDYSLFILVRYREERRNGAEPQMARATALSTSGVAIVFSGVAVIGALAGLFLIDDAAVRSMAMGAIIVVVTSVALAVTFLPQLIRAMGPRLERQSPRLTAILGWSARHRPRVLRAKPQAFWDRWTETILRRPLLYAAAASAVLLLLAAPALRLIPGEDFLRELPAGNDTRVGYERAAATVGPGAMSPIDIVVRSRSQAPVGARAVARLRAAIAAQGEVERVTPARLGDGGRSALISVVGRHFGDDPASKALVVRLRRVLPQVAPRGAEVEIGGPTAFILDGKARVFGGLWKAALFAFVMACLLMMFLLRSIVLPLKGAAMTFLSVGAAYGVMVVVFQWGWLDGFLGFRSKGFIDQTSPALVLAIVFGLSMDYEIFLLSRITERFRKTGDLTQAISHGLATSARVISGAALIMVCVFAVFIGTSLPAVKEVGVGLAIAIAIDASLVRLVLVPSLMKLFGRWNWWMPRPFARVAPPAAPAPEVAVEVPAAAMSRSE